MISELRKLGVDAETFGHFDFLHQPSPQSPEFVRLATVDQQRLVSAGAFDATTGFPRWTVSKTYYWRQTFPARSTTRVRHQYKPVAGFTGIQLASQSSDRRKLASLTGLPTQWTMSKETAQVLADACITPELQDQLTSSARMNSGWTQAYWVDYILTTANRWKTPISDFRLIVERPPDDAIGGRRRHWYVSLCWDGTVHHLDEDHFEVSTTDFVPQRELHVGFFADTH